MKAARPIRPNRNPGDTSLSPAFYQSFYFNPIRTIHYHLSTSPFSPALFFYIFYHIGFALSIGTISISAKLFAHPKPKMHTPQQIYTRGVHTFWQKGVQGGKSGLFLPPNLPLKARKALAIRASALYHNLRSNLVEAGGVEPTVRKNDHKRPATSVGNVLDFAPFGAHCQAPRKLVRFGVPVTLRTEGLTGEPAQMTPRPCYAG